MYHQDQPQPQQPQATSILTSKRIMYASTILSAALLFCGLATASPVLRSPVLRQNGPNALGYLTNDYLGGAWTKLQEGNSSAGVPIGVSPLVNGEYSRTQLMAIYENPLSNGEVLYLFAEADTGNWISMTQFTSSDHYSPGYWMLQTAPSQADAAYFTLTVGNEDGSWYMSPNYPTNGQLDWYHYDDPTANFIPVIINAIYPGSSQSWTWHTVDEL
ncbi:hypothetical protein DACRYDRAFT_102350 [Dacryopinax primogenitus]|uniref:Uncharacterized protein n=1 Tax=Dacryopinax primogenitus (strain DJM 731) TaxID=1858805 RepID=M5FWA5_DACPD|nr:uncharacterized protein DACRYDRAFT_102350 [Dacryopinax primogenitus]EJT97666.1 hypothetical protein DACRYDRAFT_102350 [Dacryopinax primogenitus]